MINDKDTLVYNFTSKKFEKFVKEEKYVYLPNYMILNILKLNPQELPKYRRIFTQPRIKYSIQAILDNKLYQQQYLMENYNHKNVALNSGKLDTEHNATPFKKLPSFIIVKILEFNPQELPKYRRVFIKDRVKRGIQAILNTELYKWQYLIKNYNYKDYMDYINVALYSDDLDVVKLGIENGATKFDNCLYSNNLDVVKLGIEKGATDFDNCLYSNNLEVVQLGIERGATDFDNCLRSNNLDIVKLGIAHVEKFDPEILLETNNINIAKLGMEYGATDFNNCLQSNNMDVVQFGIKYGATIFYLCLSSNNLDIVKLGIRKNKAYDVSDLLYSDNLNIIKLGIKKGATNFTKRTFRNTRNVDVVLFVLSYFR